MKKRKILSLLSHINRAGEVVNCMRCTSQWQDLTFAYLGFKELNFPYSFKTRAGEKILINTMHDLITV